MAEEVKKTQDEEVKPTLEDVFDDSKVTEDEDEEKSTPKRRRPRRRRKFKQNLKCPMCEVGQKSINYKEIYQLKKYTSVRGKIISTEKSGVCNKHQRQVSRAIKRARYMALLPYSSDE